MSNEIETSSSRNEKFATEELTDRMARLIEEVRYGDDESPEALAEVVKIMAMLQGGHPRAGVAEALDHLFKETVIHNKAELIKGQLEEAKGAVQAINDRVDASKGFAVLKLLDLEVGAIMDENDNLDESLLGLLEEIVTLINKIAKRSFDTVLAKENIHIPPATVDAIAVLARKVSDELALVTEGYPRSLEMSRLALYLEGLIKDQV